MLEKIISQREEVRKEERYEAKDFLDSLLDVMEDDKCEVKLTRDHIKALVLVRLRIWIIFWILIDLVS